MFWMRNKKSIFGMHSKLKVLSFLFFMFRVCHVFLSVHCSLVETCWKSADLLALLYVVFYCVLSLSHVVAWVRCGLIKFSF